MSIFGAMNSAISGLTSQSDAFGNISENVSNSQTVGFKRVDTSFVDFLTTSTPTSNQPGAVVAQPRYVNDVQGAITQTDNPLNLAIAGHGFFAVSQQTGQIAGKPTFNPQQFYSRAGDFSLNSQGYLVNSSGQFLNGWPADPVTGVVNQNALSPIQVTQTALNPQMTQNVSLSANLPATPALLPGGLPTPISSDITVYDALGTAHSVNLGWAQNAADDWNLTVTAQQVGQAIPQIVGTADVQFGPAFNGVASGTIGQITGNAPLTASLYAAATSATVGMTLDFGEGPQAVTLNLGTYGSANGVTQYAGTAYNLQGISQDGVPPGSFAGVTTQANGNVVVNYNNGQNRTIAQVPLVTFNAPDSLQGQNGQSFTATTASGTPLADAVNTNGAGSLVVSSVEGSNVDIATEFSQLIIAQQAYSANAKVVTTANDMLNSTINMKQ
jgi:flagellar hook protein FlgE